MAPDDRSGVWIDRTSRCIGRNGKIARLSPTGFRLFSIVWDAYPDGYVTHEMRSHLWADDPEGGPEHFSNLPVQAHFARKQLRRLGISIKSGRGHKAKYHFEFK